MSDEILLIQIIDLVRSYCCDDIPDDVIPEDAIHLRLDADLSIYGLDADDLLLEYSEKFNVKDGGFDFDKYFRRFGFFFFLPPTDYGKISELRIIHLVLGAIKGELSDEMIMNYNKENGLE